MCSGAKVNGKYIKGLRVDAVPTDAGFISFMQLLVRESKSSQGKIWGNWDCNCYEINDGKIYRGMDCTYYCDLEYTTDTPSEDICCGEYNNKGKKEQVFWKNGEYVSESGIIIPVDIPRTAYPTPVFFDTLVSENGISEKIANESDWYACTTFGLVCWIGGYACVDNQIFL